MVYFLKSHRTGLIKIGRTSYFRSRYSQLCFDHKEPLEILGIVSEDVWAERELHRIFKEIRIVKEWFQDSPKLRRFITQNATLDLPAADSPRNEVLVPIDRVIAAQAKKNAAERGMPLCRYLDSLLRQVVDDDFNESSGHKNPIPDQDRVAAFIRVPIVADMPERTFRALVRTKVHAFFDRFPRSFLPSRPIAVFRRSHLIHSEHRGVLRQVFFLAVLASHIRPLYNSLRRITRLFFYGSKTT